MIEHARQLGHKTMLLDTLPSMCRAQDPHLTWVHPDGGVPLQSGVRGTFLAIGASLTLSNMSTPNLVESFYQRIWNVGDLQAASDLLTTNFSFRGSLGTELRGQDAFKEYVRSIRSALAEYRCEILTCVTEGDQAFAQMRFSGRHVGAFLGYQPTGKSVHWHGAALFRFEGQAISQLWVLGDVAGLEVVLKANLAE